MPCFFRDGYQMKPVVVRPVVRVRHLWLFIAACIVLYAEWWDPDRQSSWWPGMPPEQLCRSGCLRLLLVADAHVAGEDGEPGWPLGAVTRWDSDRYLRRGFQRALEHVLPDVVVFLGDSMDGAEQATPEQLERYSHRFWSIFSVPRNVKVVSVPEPHVSGIVDSTQYSSDTRRFIEVFGNSNSNIVDFVQFYKVFSSLDLYNVTTAPLADGINILISHLPITTSILEHKASMLLRTRTNLVFSAHNHNSYIAIQGKTNGAVYRMQGMLGSQLEDISLQDDNVVEIVVPTCSYRKGMRRMGLGAAVVDRVGAIKYTVLWLPSRYKHLALYLSASLCCAVIIIGWYCCRRRRGLVQVRRTRYHHA